MWPGLRPRREVAPLKGLGFFYGGFPALTRWANEFRRCAAGAEVARGAHPVCRFRSGSTRFWILIGSLSCSMVNLLLSSAGQGTASCIPPSRHVPSDFCRAYALGVEVAPLKGARLFLRGLPSANAPG